MNDECMLGTGPRPSARTPELRVAERVEYPNPELDFTSLNGPFSYLRQGVFLSAEWRNLAIFNYEVPPELLINYVPSGTKLDLYDGKAIVSLVAFRFENTRLAGVPVPFHTNFDEVNLRFYVRRDEGGDEFKRGVVFIKEIVPKPMLTFVANEIYGESYETHPMWSEIRTDPDNPEQVTKVSYSWGREAGANRNEYQASVTVEVEGPKTIVEKGTEAHFITQHFWGYAAQEDGTTVEYQVAHPTWEGWSVKQARFAGDVSNLYGEAFNRILQGTPRSVYLMAGSPIAVYQGKKLPSDSRAAKS